MKRTLWVMGVLAIFTSLIIWLGFRYVSFYRQTVIYPVEIVKAAPQSLIGEIGPYSASGYAGTLQSYLENLQVYKTLSTVDIAPNLSPESIAVLLTPAIEAALRRDPISEAIAKRQSPDVIESLGAHISLMVARCAGMPCDEYLRRVASTGAVMRLPDNMALLQYVVHTFLPQSTIPAADSDAQAVRGLFTKIYDLGLTYRSGASRIVAWSNDGDGFLSYLREIPLPKTYGDLIFNSLDEEKRHLYFGSMSQSALVFNRAPDFPDLPASGNVLCSEVVVIVKTADGDFYPIIFQSYLDPLARIWRLRYANRQSSLRAATTPHLVF
jgi:hypothetical protein